MCFHFPRLQNVMIIQSCYTKIATKSIQDYKIWVESNYKKCTIWVESNYKKCTKYGLCIQDYKIVTWFDTLLGRYNASLILCVFIFLVCKCYDYSILLHQDS
jgi:hypothetical protein